MALHPKRSVAGQALWLCRCNCGKTKILFGGSLRSGGTKSCGCYRMDRASALGKERCGPLSVKWRGGRTLHQAGYVLILKKDHPRAASSRGYVMEHTLVMEAALGRLLLPNETVHHKNGVKSDNRLENLELWCSNHPSGQRVADQIEWAKELLTRYSPESLSTTEVDLVML